MKKIKVLKEELKDLAKTIRKQKSERCADNCGYVYGLDDNRWLARHMHIAYCLLRGRTMEEIETNPRTEPNKKQYELIMEEYRDVEDVRTCEEGSEQESTDSTSLSCGS